MPPESWPLTVVLCPTDRRDGGQDGGQGGGGGGGLSACSRLITAPRRLAGGAPYHGGPPDRHQGLRVLLSVGPNDSQVMRCGDAPGTLRGRAPREAASAALLSRTASRAPLTSAA